MGRYTDDGFTRQEFDPVVARNPDEPVTEGPYGRDDELDSEPVVAPDISQLEEEFEAGRSHTPHGCVVELPATECAHGQKTWAEILGMSEDSEVDADLGGEG